jgi:hypothetical protein
MILLVCTSFMVGASGAFAVFFAHPFSDSFWSRFNEWWGFIWVWERTTLLAIVWSACVGAALVVQRPRVGHLVASRLSLIGFGTGFLTSTIVAPLSRLFHFAASTWLGLGAGLGVVINTAIFSWVASRSAATPNAPPNSSER